MYKTLKDCPSWAKPYIEKAINKGYIVGTPNGSLNLDDNKIWCLVVMLRVAGIMA